LSNASEKPRDFQPIEDPREASQYLVEAAKTAASTLIWTKNQEKVINSRIALVSDVDRLIYAWVPQDFDMPQFMDELAQKKETDCFFSVSLSRANIFFKTRFKNYDPAGLKFALPTTIYKVQRRKDARFQIPDSYVVPLEFEDPLAGGKNQKRKIADISASGLSFTVEEKEAPVFQEGLVLKKLKFSIRSRMVSVEAEIRNRRQITPALSRVGVVFKNISESDRNHIAAYVFEENRKFFSRFL
jgi:hypothetical protein